jgi:methanogenic corrinoid protein MtbC1
MPVDGAEATRPWSEWADRYLGLLLDRERQAASRFVDGLVEQGVDVRDIYLKVFQASQREIGRLWQTNQVTVAQEHYCTAATQQIMSRLYPHIFTSTPGERKMVMACASAELHEIGARMVADFFEMAGWDTYYLGANMPVESILSEIGDVGADLLGISVALPDKIPLTAEIVDQVHGAAFDRPVKVLVGGRPFNVDPELWAKVGADGYAPDARAAVARADALVPKREGA